ncbi:MAG: type I asparaginase [Flavobacteriales bacterium]|nr:type I asparaginase [Flavobacteriales bacterium]
MTQPKVLIIYTGGTIGMIRDEKTGTLKPFHLDRVVKSIPSILELGVEVHAMELDEVIDSSNVTPEIWVELAETIGEYYEQFDGFVILHGSDTMAYSASALSFLLENLGKPVIFTGSQLPIGLPRTDARENLITALSIAAMKRDDGRALIPEVCIYFEDQLYRGNRTYKFNSENFDAFVSRNYPILAEAGVRIRVFEERLLAQSAAPFTVHTTMNTNVAVLQLFPGMRVKPYANMFTENGIELVIIESYGSGNGPTDEDFIGSIRQMVEKDIIILNITQCREGKVEMGKYETSEELLQLGVISGADLTTEAAVTKAMFVLGYTDDKTERKNLLQTPLRGEMTR